MSQAQARQLCLGRKKKNAHTHTPAGPPPRYARFPAKAVMTPRSLSSSRSRFGSSNGTPGPGPGVARELRSKSHFKGEAKFLRTRPSLRQTST
jgi:hypothetical protein